ncbi:MAG: thioredoxin domain-containing protein [Ilumatobacteraceae bacterium]|nr:thioredoxin domain-containing protein [Acidimicrobiia bacterium]
MNRLAGESSPYLRQHRDNPVDWWPWCDEAFAEARRRAVPVLLSVGYSACHWCHVMAHESFEDPEVAEVMNRLFVNVKVDREERPDVDSIYMDAVQAMTGRGGWPMTVFLTPSAQPFFGGTYYPKPTFMQLMNAIDDAWRNRRDDIDNNVAALVENIGRTSQISTNEHLPSIDVFKAAVQRLDADFDARWGGFGNAPKFPGTMALEVLLRSYLNDESPRTRQMLTTTLDAMASGGMYDHLGGGFARYSVDEKWLVPHFEKMLYDQALLIRPYLHASLVLREPRWQQVVTETIDYVLRDLRSPEGAFYSAEDADSLDESGHSHEGHFYVFTPAQVRQVVPAHLVDTALAWYEITDAGNFEGKSIPCRLTNRGDLMRSDDVETVRQLLLAARNTRHRPGLDDKVILEWNALMIASLCEAAAALHNDEWARAAQRAGEFMATTMRRADGRWLRTWHRAATPKHLAMAADLANLIDAFTRLYELTGTARWVHLAREAADQLIAHHHDATEGGFFTTPDDGERLIVRQKDLIDNATPSANSVAALALQRLAALTGVEQYRTHAEGVLKLLARIVQSAPTAFPHLLCALHLHHVGPTEVAITGKRGELVSYLQSQWLPTVVLAWGETFDTPLFADRRDGLAYVCRQYACQAPATSRDELVAALRAALSG